MDKELKEKLIRHHEENKAAFPDLYNNEWVENAADSGWKETIDDLCKTMPEFKKIVENDSALYLFTVFYYASFEKALNTFFMKIMDDTITTCELAINELQKVTAEIKTKKE